MKREERSDFAEAVFAAVAPEGNVRVRASLAEVRALVAAAEKVAMKVPDGWAPLLDRFTEEIRGAERERFLDRVDKQMSRRCERIAGYSLVIFGKAREVWLVSGEVPPDTSLSSWLNARMPEAYRRPPDYDAEGVDAYNAGANYSDAEGGL
jgi:hypothetical protein